MAPQPGIHLALCCLLAATALAARVQTSGERRSARARDSPVNRRCRARTEDFSYEGEKGPDQWPSLFPGCAGQAQSPVDIITMDVQTAKFKSPLIIPDFDWRPLEVMLINTGHTVQVVPRFADSVKYSLLQGGPLTGKYQLQSLNFHWGESDRNGSEHAVNGARFAVEMHMVFARKATRDNEMSYRTDGDLAVIVVLFKVSSRDSMQLKPIVSHLGRVVEPGREKLVRLGVSTGGLVPCSCSSVLWYNGSLTTPPCTEAVTWLVFPYPVIISSRQVAAFRKLKSRTGKLAHNLRPLQPLNGRVVYTSRSEPAFRPPVRPRAVLLFAWAASLHRTLHP